MQCSLRPNNPPPPPKNNKWLLVSVFKINLSGNSKSRSVFAALPRYLDSRQGSSPLSPASLRGTRTPRRRARCTPACAGWSRWSRSWSRSSNWTTRSTRHPLSRHRDGRRQRFNAKRAKEAWCIIHMGVLQLMNSPFELADLPTRGERYNLQCNCLQT